MHTADEVHHRPVRLRRVIIAERLRINTAQILVLNIVQMISERNTRTVYGEKALRRS